MAWLMVWTLHQAEQHRVTQETSKVLSLLQPFGSVQKGRRCQPRISSGLRQSIQARQKGSSGRYLLNHHVKVISYLNLNNKFLSSRSASATLQTYLQVGGGLKCRRMISSSDHWILHLLVRNGLWCCFPCGIQRLGGRCVGWN